MSDNIPKLGAYIAYGLIWAYALVTYIPRAYGWLPEEPEWSERVFDRLVEAGLDL